MQGQVPGSPGLLAVWRDAPEMGHEDGREGDETGARLFEPRACEVRSVVRVSVGVAGVDAVNIFVICPLVFLNSSFTVYSH